MKFFSQGFWSFQLFKKNTLILFFFILILSFWNLEKIKAQAFVTEWKTTDGTITIPTNTSTGTYNYNIIWTNQTNTGQGDGSITAQTGDYTISGLSNDDTYQVEITGTFPHFFMNYNPTESVKLQSIKQWGSINWLSMARAFEGCENMIYEATDTPNLSSVTSLHRTFADCFSFNGNINDWLASSNPNMVNDIHEIFAGASSFNQPLDMWVITGVTNTSGLFDGASSFNQPLDMWDVTNVTTMAAMFRDATAFNQPLNAWGTKTGNVGDMEMMFTGASSFNQPLNLWDVSNVNNNVGGMRGMFSEATSFNQPLNDWDVSNVVIMNNMFSKSAFDQPLDMWDVDNVEDMGGMFANTPFNQDISDWNVSSVQFMSNMFSGATSFNNGGNALTWTTGTSTANVTDMFGMFADATSFNQDLTNWDVSSVEDMSGMFSGATSFNGDMSGWDVINVQFMTGMFSEATSFNQPLTNNWNNVSSVQDMSGMFADATSFNQDLTNWDVSSVEDMSGMFFNAVSFNQNLGSWDISSVISPGMTSMLDNSGLNVENYESTLVGWAALSSPPSGVDLGANGLQYCGDGVEAKGILENTYSWIITDAGVSATCAKIDTSDFNNNASVDAGKAVINSSDTLSFTIENTGSIDLILDNFNTTGDFTYAGDATLTISSNSSESIKLTVPTNNLGPKNGTISFDSNDPSFTSFNLQLSAEVTVAPPINLIGYAASDTIGCDWTDVAEEETFYAVEVAINSDADSSFVRVGLLDADSKSFRMKADISNVTYIFRVQALGPLPDTLSSAWGSNFAIAIPTDFALGVEEASQSGILTLYPNPVEDVVQIEVNSSEEIKVQVFDLQGQLLEEQYINSSSTWNMRNYPTGQYLFLFQIGDVWYQQKVLKK